MEATQCPQVGRTGTAMLCNSLVLLTDTLKSWTKIKFQKAGCLNAMWYFGLEPRTEKGHLWKNW